MIGQVLVCGIGIRELGAAADHRDVAGSEHRRLRGHLVGGVVDMPVEGPFEVLRGAILRLVECHGEELLAARG